MITGGHSLGIRVGALLQEGTDRVRASGSETPRLDAELLLGHVLGIERTQVLAHPEAPVGDGQAAAFRDAVERRIAGEPVAYIRGIKEFYGIAFSIDARALIPRPETERLVELAVDRVREVLTGAPRPVDAGPFRIWDVGTGSGAIAVAIAVTLRRRGYAPDVRIAVSDVSRDALGLALENAVAHGVADTLDASVGDLVDVEPAPAIPVDLLVANLPYIPTDAMPNLAIAASFEPSLALDGGPDGLAVVRRLMKALPGVVAPAGRALLEIGADQADAAVEAAADALPGWAVTVHADLGGRPRVLQLDPVGVPA